jgi:aspartyl protease family protein
MKNLLVLCAALVVFSVVATGGISAPKRQEVSQAKTGTGKPIRPTRQGYGEAMVLQRDSSGQFRLTGQIDGNDVTFLVDTGADVVALTVEDAQALGLDIDPDQFEPVSRTASGVGYGMPVLLDRIAIGGEEFENVDAVVIDGLTTNLLGQSVLRRMGRVELRGDRMVIHPG